MRVFIILFAGAFLFHGCSSQADTVTKNNNVIRIKGSDSMLLLVQRLADQYMLQHPGISIDVEGGGSGSGIRSLIDGKIDLCATSRPLSPDEVRQLAQKYQSIGVSILCAKDALNIVVHPSNPVSGLSLRQIVDLFTGAQTNWKDVGGADLPVTLYGRESNSGTFLYFEDHVLLGEKYSDASIVEPGARALIDAVAHDSSAIGYSTSVYSGTVKSLAVGGVLPTPDNIRNGTYPITRYLYFYTVYQPEGEIKRFLDWVVSKEGQRTATVNGYIPLYAVE